MEMKEASSDIVKNIEKILAYEAEHQKEIERYEDIIQKLKKREMKRTRMFYKALHEIWYAAVHVECQDESSSLYILYLTKAIWQTLSMTFSALLVLFDVYES